MENPNPNPFVLSEVGPDIVCDVDMHEKAMKYFSLVHLVHKWRTATGEVIDQCRKRKYGRLSYIMQLKDLKNDEVLYDVQSTELLSVPTGGTEAKKQRKASIQAFCEDTYEMDQRLLAVVHGARYPLHMVLVFRVVLAP